jgi:hypothetical protein
VVHFTAALIVAAILSAPWTALRAAGVAVALCGVTGVCYTAIVTRRALRQHGYKPVLEDWIWHNILPGIAYGTLMVAGVLIEQGHTTALFAIGAVTLLLVCIGIHNAWDTVTYIVHREGEGAAVKRAVERPVPAIDANAPVEPLPTSSQPPSLATPPQPPKA